MNTSLVDFGSAYRFHLQCKFYKTNIVYEILAIFFPTTNISHSSENIFIQDLVHFDHKIKMELYNWKQMKTMFGINEINEVKQKNRISSKWYTICECGVSAKYKSMYWSEKFMKYKLMKAYCDWLVLSDYYVTNVHLRIFEIDKFSHNFGFG